MDLPGGWTGEGEKRGGGELLAAEQLESLAQPGGLWAHTHARFQSSCREQTCFLREAEMSSGCPTLVTCVL